jgi:hypothetical protein
MIRLCDSGQQRYKHSLVVDLSGASLRYAERTLYVPQIDLYRPEKRPAKTFCCPQLGAQRKAGSPQAYFRCGHKLLPGDHVEDISCQHPDALPRRVGGCQALAPSGHCRQGLGPSRLLVALCVWPILFIAHYVKGPWLHPVTAAKVSVPLVCWSHCVYGPFCL